MSTRRIARQSEQADLHERLAARQIAEYLCRRGHQRQIPFAATAVAPGEWECTCGSPARLVRPDGPETLRAALAALDTVIDGEHEVSQMTSGTRDADTSPTVAGQLARRGVSDRAQPPSASDETVRP